MSACVRIPVCVLQSKRLIHYLGQLPLFSTSPKGTQCASHSLTFCLSLWSYNSAFKLWLSVSLNSCLILGFLFSPAGPVVCHPLHLFSAILNTPISSGRLHPLQHPISSTLLIFSSSMIPSRKSLSLYPLVNADDSISHFDTAESPDLLPGELLWWCYTNE